MNAMAGGICNLVAALVLAPILPGIINRVKAFFAGRKGQPIFQTYYDVAKLFEKGAVYSTTATLIFRIAPSIGFAAACGALLYMPGPFGAAVGAFNGDIILVVYLFALMRFFLVLAALDTGSSFSGMGASREIQFSVFAESALFLGLLALARQSQSLSLSGMYAAISPESWAHTGTIFAMISITFFIVYLAENSRVPVDDPATHLELTMVHEAMVLDSSGPDFGLLMYTAALRLWMLGVLIAGMVFPFSTGSMALDAVLFVAGLGILAVTVGIVESVMARLSLLKVPQLLIAAASFSALALLLQIR